MGEIGIPRLEFLYELRYQDMLLISRGYERRKCYDWSMTRWMTYHIMMAQVGSKELVKIGVHSPADLISLPTDTDATDEDDDGAGILSDEDVKRMRQQIKEYNQSHGFE